jgi:hypothetical protein
MKRNSQSTQMMKILKNSITKGVEKKIQVYRVNLQNLQSESRDYNNLVKKHKNKL